MKEFYWRNEWLGWMIMRRYLESKLKIMPNKQPFWKFKTGPERETKRNKCPNLMNPKVFIDVWNLEIRNILLYCHRCVYYHNNLISSIFNVEIIFIIIIAVLINRLLNYWNNVNQPELSVFLFNSLMPAHILEKKYIYIWLIFHCCNFLFQYKKMQKKIYIFK